MGGRSWLCCYWSAAACYRQLWECAWMFTEMPLLEISSNTWTTLVHKYLARIYYIRRNVLGVNGGIPQINAASDVSTLCYFCPSPMYTNWPSDVTIASILLTRIWLGDPYLSDSPRGVLLSGIDVVPNLLLVMHSVATIGSMILWSREARFLRLLLFWMVCRKPCLTRVECYIIQCTN